MKKADLDGVEREIVQITQERHSIQKNNGSNNFKLIFKTLTQYFNSVSSNETNNTADIAEAVKLRKEINYIKTHISELIKLPRKNWSNFFSISCRAELDNTRVRFPSANLIRC